MLFSGWAQRSDDKLDQTEAALRAASTGSAQQLQQALDALHDGRKGPWGNLCTLLFLAKTAKRVCIARQPTAAGLSDEDRMVNIEFVHPSTLDWGMELAERFNVAVAICVWAAFRQLEEAFVGAENSVPATALAMAARLLPDAVPPVALSRL